MSSPTVVVVKFPADVKNVTVDFTDVLAGGEVISSGSIGASNPVGLTVSGLSFTTNTIQVQVASGTDMQSYGVPITANTDQGHVYTKMLAVVVNADLAANYQNTNDQAFNALVGKLEAGTAALGMAAFLFPAGFDSANGAVGWELLDQTGTVYAQGQAFDYQAVILANGVRVEAQAVINAPSNMRPTLDGQIYQIRWTLTVGGAPYYSFESLEVTGPNTVPEGVEDIVELADVTTFNVNLVTNQPFDLVTVSIYTQNQQTINPVGATAIQTADGWMYTAQMTNTNLPANLDPYTLVWSCSNTSRPDYVERQIGRLFLVNPSILTATEDMRIMISKARSTIFGTSDILFTVPLLLAYLRRGRDAFNIAYGMFTGFTMLNAQGGIREFWIKFSEVLALRAQFLAEGEKVFNFGGQAITLDVDRTSYYQTMADGIQSYLDNEGKQVKQNLIKKGIIGGDGNVSDLQLQQRGAGGAIGITLSPATNWGKYSSRYGLRY